MLAVFKMLVRRGCMFLCLLFYSHFFDLPFELSLNTRLIFFQTISAVVPKPLCGSGGTEELIAAGALLLLCVSCPIGAEVRRLFSLDSSIALSSFCTA